MQQKFQRLSYEILVVGKNIIKYASNNMTFLIRLVCLTSLFFYFIKYV